MERAERTFVTRCSLAVRPIDVWNGAVPGPSAVQIWLEETDRKPIRASDGSYVFLDVPNDRCTLRISSPIFMEVRKEIPLPTDGGPPPVVTVSLYPNRVYAPPPAATGVIVDLRDAAGLPLAGVPVFAYADDEMAVRGRLAEDKGGEEESPLVKVSPANGKLSPGDAFVLRDRESKDGAELEWHRIADWTEQASVYTLDKPLGGKWSRGAKLLAAAQTVSDATGTVVLPFRGLLPQNCRIVADIFAGGKSSRVVWQIEGGRVVRLPAAIVNRT
jgi:hypothetical protein